MSDVDLIIERLKDRVSRIWAMRVVGAAEFAALTATGAVPQVTPAAHVIPTGISGASRCSRRSGLYIQAIERHVLDHPVPARGRCVRLPAVLIRPPI